MKGIIARVWLTDQLPNCFLVHRQLFERARLNLAENPRAVVIHSDLTFNIVQPEAARRAHGAVVLSIRDQATNNYFPFAVSLLARRTAGDWAAVFFQYGRT